MGTVIDPDMGDDLRVTVVATGLGEPKRSSLTREKPMRLVANGTYGPIDGRVGDGRVGDGRAGDGRPGEGRLGVNESEREPAPVYNRDRRFAVPDVGSKDLFERQKDIDYLDIPSFLRTQAD
jgi:cell division protein FtsZ